MIDPWLLGLSPPPAPTHAKRYARRVQNMPPDEIHAQYQSKSRDDALRRIVACVGRHPGWTRADIERHVGLPRSTAIAYLNALVREGRLRTLPSWRNKHPINGYQICKS